MKLGTEHKGTPKATESPTSVDIGWAAGFYEGDGNCTSNRRGCQSARIVQKNKEPLERMQFLFGGSLGEHDYKRKGAYTWTISGPRARGFLLTVYPLLSERRKVQIREVM